MGAHPNGADTVTLSLDDEEAAWSACKQQYEHVFSAKGLHFLHLNARSLLPNIDEIRLLALNLNVGVICVTESWLDSSIRDTEIEISNYVVVRKDRNRHGGGIYAFVRSDINFIITECLDSEQEDIEVILLDIRLPKTKPLLLGVCYRPPLHNTFVIKN